MAVGIWQSIPQPMISRYLGQMGGTAEADTAVWLLSLFAFISFFHFI